MDNEVNLIAACYEKLLRALRDCCVPCVTVKKFREYAYLSLEVSWIFNQFRITAHQ